MTATTQEALFGPSQPQPAAPSSRVARGSDAPALGALEGAMGAAPLGTSPKDKKAPEGGAVPKAREGGEADRLGKNTNKVSADAQTPAERLRSLLLEDAIRAKQQEARMRFYGLRWTAQDILNMVQDDKVKGIRYVKRDGQRTGELVEVEDSKYHRQLGCGIRRVQDFVGIRRGEGGVCYYEGIMKCGSIWPCPVCSQRVRRGRAAEIQTAVGRWLVGYEKEGRAKGSAVFVTFTPRHNVEMTLEETFAVVQSCFGKAGIFSGRPGQRLKASIGWEGQIRATEVTVGRNGWHPHIHVLMFLSGEQVSEFRLNMIEDLLYAAWSEHVEKAGLPSIKNASGRRRSVQVEAIRDVEELAKYLVKVEGMDPEQSGGWGVGNEMARGDLKKGRVVLTDDEEVSTFGMFQLLELVEAHHAGAHCPNKGCTKATRCEDYTRAVGYFINYVDVTKGKTAIHWSHKLKKRLGIGEVSDEELAEEGTDEDDAVERLVHDLGPTDWMYVVRHRMQAQVLAAAELGGMVQVERLMSTLRY